MKVYLFLSDKLINFTLPQDISGSFSFDENKEEDAKLINIEARDNKWFLYATEDVSIIDNNQIVKEKEISKNQFYFLCRNKINYLIYICDRDNSKFDIYNYDEKINMIIGNTGECNVKYSVGSNDKYLAKIKYDNNQFVLDNSNKTFIYVNNKKLRNPNYLLKYGDLIVIYSLKIIFLKNIIIISNPMYKNYLQTSSGLTKKEIVEDQIQELEIKDRDLYSKDDYFSKSPRIRRIIEEKEIKLSNPPRNDKNSELPLILTIGPMITMALVSGVSLFNTISRLLSGEASLSQQLPTLITPIFMMISTLLWPLITRTYNKRLKKKRQKEIIEKYNKYLSDKKIELDNEYKLQKEIIIENLIDCNDCLTILQRKSYNFWDKRVDQDDFLFVRIGIGKTLLKVKTRYPEDGFTIDEDELQKQADELINSYKYINDVPIGYSFLENRITAIMGNAKKSYGFINNIILQLITFYSYEDVKFVIFTNDNNEDNWSYIKYLNHNFNNERSFRFFSSDIDSSKYLSDYLLNEINYRMNVKFNFPKPHYIIITDDYETIKNYDFIKNITETDANLGFSCIILENRLSKLPSKCNNFISLGIDNQSGILKNSYQKQEQEYFTDQINYDIDMMQIAKEVSNIPIEFEGGISHLPDAISFMEMEKVGKVEQLNILNRWNTNDSTTSLKAEIGVDEQNNLMYLDLHEKAHGPHGLIAGTTGSGKSEFIITYILSMCINFSPDDVSFILIDYKGGGLALAFENKSTGVMLPHLAGTITNLDKAEMDRTLVSIDSEVKRRQKMFNEARDNLGESTIDIYKYQRFYHEGRLEEPIPHLFIICDEFAELKSQQPDFMDNLISVARIGRSLGVHLILATQKPSGVVNDQIWSNSKFKVCLKVQDESDSREMLKKNDAAYLKQAGRYYLQVGYDEYFALGQSGWCGAKYYPSDKIIKQVDKSINIINDCGLFIKSIQASNGVKIEAQGEQLSAVLKTIIETSKRVNKVSKRLWLDNIPDIILIDDLEKKYAITYDHDNIEVIIGEYDAPEKQEQGIVKYNFLNDGNTIIYGNDGGERDLFLNALIYSTIKNYSSNDISFYAVDYGSEMLNQYLNENHFGGVVVNGEDEEFHNLFKLIKNEIKKRKKVLADYGGDYKIYLSKVENRLPIMVIILNNYESIYETNSNIYDELPELVRDSERYGIVFIFTGGSVNSIHSKVATNCKNVYTLKMKDQSDYGNVLGKSTKMSPREISGRGLINNDGIHEFQTARIVSDDGLLNEYLSEFIRNINASNSKVKSIPLLPEIVGFNDIRYDINDLSNVPIGISKSDLDIITYDFKFNIGNLISSNILKNTEKFIKSLLYVLSNIKDNNLFIIDPLKSLNLDKTMFPNYFFSNIEEVVNNIINNIKKLFENKQVVNGIIMIYGLNKFVNSIKKDKLEELSKIIKSYEKISIVFVEDIGKTKTYMYESWLSSIVSTSDGIWIGKGISDQSVFKISTITKALTMDLKNNMGYTINEGGTTLCKLIDFVSKGDEDGE